jgi:hypothetical protein
LTDWVAEGRAATAASNHGARWCQLGSLYIGKDSPKLVSKDFHNGVIKLQKNRGGQLTPPEKAAVSSLIKGIGEVSENLETTVVDLDLEEPIDLFDARVAKKLKVEAEEQLGEYFDCSFILGSAAEVERVWSTADQILKPARFSTSPYLLEAILFLKYNSKYWDTRTVVKAIQLLQEKNSTERYEKDVSRYGLLKEEEDDSDKV